MPMCCAILPTRPCQRSAAAASSAACSMSAAAATRKPVRKLLDKLRRKNFPARVIALLREMQVADQAAADVPRLCPCHDLSALAKVCRHGAGRSARHRQAARVSDRDQGISLRARTCSRVRCPRNSSETFYPRVSELQEALGTINDHAVAIDYWSSAAGIAPGKKSQAWLNRELPQRAAALQLAHEKFLASWSHQWAALVKEWETA